jgi:tetratricopeptide (TPR) repeat protein
LLQGSSAKALEVFDRIPEEQYRLYGVALAQFSLGRIRESDEALAELVARWSHGWAYQISEVYGWRGDRDRAFEWLERAFAQRDGGLGNIKYDPFLRSIHGDPRFTGLLKKLNLPVD